MVFRKQSRPQNQNIKGVREAQNPFQPYLAYWGLFWSGFIGTYSAPQPQIRLRELIFAAFFQGSKAFLGLPSPYWSKPDNWFFVQIASFVGIALLLGLVLLSTVVLPKGRAFEEPDFAEAFLNQSSDPTALIKLDEEELDRDDRIWDKRKEALLNAL